MMSLLIFLGLFVDQVSMMLITLPVFIDRAATRYRPDLVRRAVPDLRLGLLLPPRSCSL
jgi:hypothetical protein